MLHHTYADDTQAYSILELPSKWEETSAQVTACMKDFQFWMETNMLKLNQDKFEFIVFHPKTTRINAQNLTITIDNNTFINIRQCQEPRCIPGQVFEYGEAYSFCCEVMLPSDTLHR